MTNLLYGIHDREGHGLLPSGGWCVESLAMSENPHPTDYTALRADINWMPRLNWAHNGKDGTIPASGHWNDYAKRCAAYVLGQRGATHFIIANEPNHANERPNGQEISPEAYGDCFNLVYQTIKMARPDAQILTAGVAPWYTEDGQPEWLIYLRRMLNRISACDGLALHAYTHGADPDLIWSIEKVSGWYWHFPVIYQQIEAIPTKFAGQPVHITESNQGDNAWIDVDSGWVRNAYQSIDQHNQTKSSHKIQSLSLYRWQGDQWALKDKPGVQNDFRQALTLGYKSPAATLPPRPKPPRPTPPDPQPPEPAPPSGRDIDPRLALRGVTFEYAKVPAGTPYWRITKARWLDEVEADAVGPDHHILGTLKRDGVEKAGHGLRIEWPSGHHTVFSKADDPNATYNYDFNMTSSLNEFSIYVDEREASDKASGIGMGKLGNPSIHTSTWIEWEYTIEEQGPGPTPEPPEPPDPDMPPLPTKLLHPCPHTPITQSFYQNPENYAKFNLPGHNGTDFGCPLGSKIGAIAAGVVAFSGYDVAYGNYIRLYHEQLSCYSFYAHLSRIDVPVGHTLYAGAIIGLSGSSGNSTGPHLHLEIRLCDRDGQYLTSTPMPKGRLDPQSWAAMHGLKL
jgi:murein DD-endopeptidase MepM/ murein hydrolase activator NlpD